MNPAMELAMMSHVFTGTQIPAKESTF